MIIVGCCVSGLSAAWEPLNFSNTCETPKSSFFTFAPLESRKETRGNRLR